MPRSAIREIMALSAERPGVIHLELGEPYALIDVSRTGRDSTTFAKEFLLAENVAVVPGVTCGPSCDRLVRAAFTAADADLRTGLERLRAGILAAGRGHR